MRSLCSALLMVIGVYLALAGASSVYVGLFGAHPIRWTFANRQYLLVPEETPHALAIGAGSIAAALLLGAFSVRIWRTKR